MSKIIIPIVVVVLVIAGMILYFSGESRIFSILSNHKMESSLKQDYGFQLGTIRNPLPCSEAANPQVEKGLALLHHMTYEGAREAFSTAAKIDPNCFMGYWGQAMTYIHPLWSDPPSKEDFDKAHALLQNAGSLNNLNEKQLAYLAAALSYFEPGQGPDEKPNLAAFSKGWEEVHKKYPEDIEAASFYALALMATADPTDKTYAKQKQAAEIAKKVLLKEPNHPGAHHYIIHAYDYPELAEQALTVSYNYSKIAPEIPHAIHMPSHIFTRVGFWKDSIEMNSRSADASLKLPIDGKIRFEYLHALDYLAYAYLQQGREDKAKEILEKVASIQEDVQDHFASAYPFAAIPSRYALERNAWEEAASLEPKVPSSFPKEKYPVMDAITEYTIALGAAKSGDENKAQNSLKKLEKLRDQTSVSSPYWAKQIEIQRLSANAWLLYKQGKKKDALQIMNDAKELEASTEKHPVTPGDVLPAQELLADMLLEEGRNEEALAQYEESLHRNANRLKSLYGAGLAAEKSGNTQKATKYYRKLIDTADKDSTRPEVAHAHKFLDHPDSAS